MFRAATVVLVGLFGLAPAGCSNGGHSCKLGATCEDYAAKDDKALAIAQHGCETVKGSWQATSCPSAGRIGTCTYAGETGSAVLIYYGDGPDAFTAANASANCEHERHGTWTPAK
jgi:hypothetical protein